MEFPPLPPLPNCPTALPPSPPLPGSATPTLVALPPSPPLPPLLVLHAPHPREAKDWMEKHNAALVAAILVLIGLVVLYKGIHAL